MKKIVSVWNIKEKEKANEQEWESDNREMGGGRREKEWKDQRGEKDGGLE